MSHIFISYSRKDIIFAQNIVDALAAQKMDIWIDWKSIPPTVGWEMQIYGAIERADAFLFLISPDSVGSKMCHAEIAQAVQNGKRIVPILIRDTDSAKIPRDVSKIQWIRCRDGQDDFQKAIEAVRETIHTDYEWVEYHTKLQTKAREWERKRKEKSFLLRGKELEDAELQVARNTSKEPYSTDLQREYLVKSRQAIDRQQRIERTIAIVVATVMTVLAGSAIIQSRLAEERARIARSGELAAASVSNLSIDPERSILLAMHAITEINARGEALQEAVDALQRALHTSRVKRIIRIYDNQGSGAPAENFSADNWVNDVAFSPNGELIAVARTDGKAQIWDANANLIQEFSGHTGWVHTVAFSPDGKLLATAGSDRTVRIWEIATGDSWKILYEHTAEINNVTFSPDGSKLASASWDGTAKIWDVAGGQVLHTIDVNLPGENSTSEDPAGANPVRVMDVAFDKNGARLALAMGDGTAGVWDASSGVAITKLSKGHAAGINSIIFSPDGESLATASDDKTVKVWDPETGAEVLLVTGHFESVRSVTFSLDGLYLVTGSIDGTVKMWDPNTGQNLITFVGHSNSVDSIAYTANQERLASASRDGTIRIWNAAIGHTSSVNSVVFSPDGKYFATASDDKTAKLWDSNSGQELQTFVDAEIQLTHGGRVTDVGFSPDGSRLASTGDDGTVKIWDIKTFVLLSTMNKFPDADTVLAFSPDGARLATAGSKGVIKIWDIKSESVLYEWKGHTDRISGILFTEDGKSLITSSLDKTTRIWDLKSTKVMSSFTNGLIRDVSISPDGKWVATADDDGQVKLWRVSEAPPEILLEHDNKIYDLAFDPNGNRLATASWDKTTKLWFYRDGNLTEGAVQWVFYSTTEVYRVAFSPDGRRLAIATVDGQVNVYLLDVNELREYAKTRVSRSFTEDECNQYFPQQTCPSIP